MTQKIVRGVLYGYFFIDFPENTQGRSLIIHDTTNLSEGSYRVTFFIDFPENIQVRSLIIYDTTKIVRGFI